MSNAKFSLTYGDKGSFLDGPVPAELRIPLAGHETKTVKKKAVVGAGTLVADHKNAKTGNLHSGIPGTVADITADCVVVAALEAPAEGEAPAVPASPAPVNLASLQGEPLAAALKELGVDTRPLLKKCDTLIINGLNPEPGITFAETMLSAHKATLEAGLGVLRKLSPASKMVLACPEGAQTSLSGVTSAGVKAEYPNSLDELLIAKVSGSEKSSGYRVLPLHTLYNLGRVAETGLPLTEAVVSVQGVNYTVKIGTPVSVLLQHAGHQIADGDMVIVGGPMRGSATANLMLGIGKDTAGLFLIKQGTFAPVTNHQCISCGECVLNCPARIMPGLVSRYVEVRQYDHCTKEGIQHCMECGLCAYYCPARRPMLQIIRLGKHQIALKEAQVSACSLQGEEGVA
ncbi:NADH:quinone oxidoreductase subunit RnfC [Desulfovibrio psychrotolerans]|uniref:Electron transport complex protein RnfC n=1 Tax=Desulfovibrio psychrotolerans TaxID=415242 RepID=A0A7J0BRF8_9BACT|nr:NADH:quinone oxidoreductase subunit RnfC [Desulfovibrio psychrotolerans]GFM36303.1 electron transport complex protein RnfC [Desulfovibrio psychrotolerans]